MISKRTHIEMSRKTAANTKDFGFCANRSLGDSDRPHQTPEWKRSWYWTKG